MRISLLLGCVLTVSVLSSCQTPSSPFDEIVQANAEASAGTPAELDNPIAHKLARCVAAAKFQRQSVREETEFYSEMTKRMAEWIAALAETEPDEATRQSYLTDGERMIRETIPRQRGMMRMTALGALLSRCREEFDIAKGEGA